MSSTRRLRSLLMGAKSDGGLTLDKIVENAGGRLKRSTADNLLKQEYRSEPLNRETLKAIAAGFGVPYEAVRVAHLSDMGLLTTDYDSAVETAMRLSSVLVMLEGEREREVVLAVARATALTLSAADPGWIPAGVRNELVHGHRHADVLVRMRQEDGSESLLAVEVKTTHGTTDGAAVDQLVDYLRAAGFSAEREAAVAGRAGIGKTVLAVVDAPRQLAARPGKPEHAVEISPTEGVDLDPDADEIR